MERLEVLADAIAAFNGYREPDHLLYRLCNPIGLKAHRPEHERVGELRVFEKHEHGRRAALYDLEAKCSGRNPSLRPDSPLVELLKIVGLRDASAEYVVKFVRKALADEHINATTAIRFFVEE